MRTRQVAIYGAGGFGRELAWLVQSCSVQDQCYEVACFIDDNKTMHGATLNGVQVMSLQEAHERLPSAVVIVGVGSPAARERLVEKAAAAGFGFETMIHPGVERSQRLKIGIGSVICAGSILTTEIVLGQHVQINLDCTIGHDVVMGDYSTLAPGVHVSGFVHLGRRSYVGTGAVIINGTPESPLLIGDDVTIGAGACVVRSVPAGLTVVGVPAKPLQK